MAKEQTMAGEQDVFPNVVYAPTGERVEVDTPAAALRLLSRGYGETRPTPKDAKAAQADAPAPASAPASA